MEKPIMCEVWTLRPCRLISSALTSAILTVCLAGFGLATETSTAASNTVQLTHESQNIVMLWSNGLGLCQIKMEFGENVASVKRLRPDVALYAIRFQSGLESVFTYEFNHANDTLSIHRKLPDGVPIRWQVVAPSVDRIVFQRNGQFSVVSGGQYPKNIASDSGVIAVQDTVRQHGIWIAPCPSVRMEKGKSSKGMMIGLDPGMSSLRLGHFSGDSIIALENAAKPALIASGQRVPTSISDTQYMNREIIPWLWFSDLGRAFHPLRADPREAAFHIGFMQNDHGETFEDLSVGGDLGLIHGYLSKDEKVSLTARGLLAARFDMFSESFDLLNVDFRGGVAGGYTRGDFSSEAYIYHQSSHLGDEVLEQKRRSRIDYSREVVRVLGAWRKKSWRFYGGPSWVAHSYPRSAQGDWIIQLGVEYTFHILGQPLFSALDTQVQQEHDWYANITGRFGVELGNPETVRNRQFMFIELFHGYSQLGQYWSEKEGYAMLGIGYYFR